MTANPYGSQFAGILNDQLSHNLYERTAKAIEALGGKWEHAKKAHIFKDDPRVQLKGILDTGAITVAKEGWFPTPEAIVEQMIEWSNFNPRYTILEPYAGEGAIVDVLVEHGTQKSKIICVELNTQRATILMKKGYTVLNTDFMAISIDRFFDRIYMNPPFEVGQDIEYVMRAYNFLKPGGVLMAVMSNGAFFREDAKTKAFRQWFNMANGAIIDLPEHIFRESGTDVRATLVRLVR
jgi:phospholipid N-methyltransferase